MIGQFSRRDDCIYKAERLSGGRKDVNGRDCVGGILACRGHVRIRKSHGTYMPGYGRLTHRWSLQKRGIRSAIHPLREEVWVLSIVVICMIFCISRIILSLLGSPIQARHFSCFPDFLSSIADFYFILFFTHQIPQPHIAVLGATRS